MDKVHIARDRESLGQFTPEEVREGLESGRFRPSDLLWKPGMSNWQPISDLPEFASSSPPSPPQPPPLGGSQPPSPASPSSPPAVGGGSPEPGAAGPAGKPEPSMPTRPRPGGPPKGPAGPAPGLFKPSKPTTPEAQGENAGESPVQEPTDSKPTGGGESGESTQGPPAPASPPPTATEASATPTAAAGEGPSGGPIYAPGGRIGGKPVGPQKRAAIAWEHQGQHGYFGSMGMTIRDMLFSPGDVCRGIGKDHGLGKPLSFYLTISFFLALLVVALLGVVLALLPVVVSQVPEVEGLDLSQVLGAGIGIWLAAGLGILVAVMIMITIWAFVASAVYHVLLAIFGAAKEGFAATFAVTCYAFGSTSILVLIPCVGGIVQWVWLIFALTLGYAAAHKTDIWRTASVTVLMFLLCCGINVLPQVLMPAVTEAIERGEMHQTNPE